MQVFAIHCEADDGTNADATFIFWSMHIVFLFFHLTSASNMQFIQSIQYSFEYIRIHGRYYSCKFQQIFIAVAYNGFRKVGGISALLFLFYFIYFPHTVQFTLFTCFPLFVSIEYGQISSRKSEKENARLFLHCSFIQLPALISHIHNIVAG